MEEKVTVDHGRLQAVLSVLLYGDSVHQTACAKPSQAIVNKSRQQCSRVLACTVALEKGAQPLHQCGTISDMRIEISCNLSWTLDNSYNLFFLYNSYNIFRPAQFVQHI